MLRRLLLVLVFTQFILLVALAVLIGGYALAESTADPSSAKVLWWAAMTCLMLIVMDVLLLIGVLGVHALVNGPPQDPNSS